MAWDVEGTTEFADWYHALDPADQEAVDDSVDRLVEKGPALGRPHVDTIRTSTFPNMKELRTQSKGRPLRTLFAFDPRRSAILLIGGDKSGDDRFYKKIVSKPIGCTPRISKN